MVKNMARNNIPPQEIPDWFLEADEFMQHANRCIRNIDLEMRHTAKLSELDPRLRDEMQFVRDALGTAKVSLSVMDMTAGKVHKEIVADKPSNINPNVAE